MKPVQALSRFLSDSATRRTLTAAAISSVAAVLLPAMYRLWGIPLLADAYNGRSVAFLNRIVATRKDHPLEEYYSWAESVLGELVFVLAALSLVLLCVAIYAYFVAAKREHTRYVNRLDAVVFVLGLSASTLMVFWFEGAYYESDINTFVEWQISLNDSLANIYLACPSCNYPFLGTLLSAGVFQVIKAVSPTLDFETYAQLFQYLLSFIDAINVLFAYFVIRALGIPRSLFWAGLIGLLPSSWAGSAVWGQIDGITQFFILAFLLWQLAFLAGHDRRPFRISPGLYVAGSSFFLACLLLTKQLALFSVPVLACMTLAILYLRARNNFLALSSALAVLVAIGIVLPDVFLNVEAGYLSHLHYILAGGGSAHGDKISGNGFNIWMLLGRDMWSSSSEPFVGSLTPKAAGVFLFLAYEIILFGTALRWFGKRLANLPTVPHKELFLTFVFLLALTNLSFNVLITGTHERYLYHFYPYMLIAYLGFRQTAARSKLLPAAILFGSVFYGRFVWGVLRPEAANIPHELVAAFHLWLLVFLTIVFMRQTLPSVGNRDHLAGEVRTS